MTIDELLVEMGILGVGITSLTPDDKQTYLRYLNLAHLELYRHTAAINSRLLQREDLTNNLNTNSVTLSKVPLDVNVVYSKNQKIALVPISIQEAIKIDPDFSKAGKPQNYIQVESSISLFPSQTEQYPLTIWYIPQPNKLTEATLEAEIPYPLAYHPVLVDGALYYLFQDESGFRNPQKMNESLVRWKDGKSALYIYLSQSTKQKPSTFSNV